MQGKALYELEQDITFNEVQPSHKIHMAHTTSIQTLSVHPSHKYFASGSHDKTIKIWDINTWKSTSTLVGHKQGVWSLDYSIVGKHLLSGSADHSVLIWDVNSGKPEISLKGHIDKVYCAKYNQNNKYISSTGEGGDLFIWDINKTDKPLHKLNLQTSICYDIQWSKNGQMMFVTTFGSKIYAIDAHTFEIITYDRVTDVEDSRCQSCAINFSILPGRVFCATDRGNISWYQYNKKTKKLVKQTEFLAHKDACRYTTLHPTKKLLLSSSRDGSVRLWDCSNEGHPKIKANLVYHTENVTCGAFVGEDLILTSSWDQHIGAWKIKVI